MPIEDAGAGSAARRTGDARSTTAARAGGEGSGRRNRRRLRLAVAALVVVPGSLLAGFELGRQVQPSTGLRPVAATRGVAPWAAPGSDRVQLTGATAAAPAPVADPRAPGVALASGGYDLGDPVVAAGASGYQLYASQSAPFFYVPTVGAAPGGSWGTAVDALATLPGWAGPGPVTGPDAQQFGPDWDLYFSAPLGVAQGPRCIGVATGPSPAGPFTAAPAPLVCQPTGGSSTDPRVFVTTAGTPYLVWVAGPAAGGTGSPLVAWSQQLAAGGAGLVGTASVLYRPDEAWQEGTIADANLVGGGGREWLVYSAGGGFTSAVDAIGVAACSGPSGPCADSGPGPLLASNDQGTGPGAPSVMTTDGEDWLVYNPSSSPGGQVPRGVDAALLAFGPSGPYLATPGTAEPGAAAPGPQPASLGAGTGPSGGDGPVVNAAGITAVQAAITQLGVPYEWGGEQPGSGFDCSGLVQWAWGQAGVGVPRTAAAQYAALAHVNLTALRPGDLLFYFNLDGDATVDHVVMYVGSGPYATSTVVQAPSTGSTVSLASVWSQGLVGAARP